MASNVTVYSQPNCVQCKATMRLLTQQNISFHVVDLTEDAEALERMKGRGYLQAPIVETSENTWSGFRPDLIKSLSRA